MAQKDLNALMARLDERTVGFQKSLELLAQEQREGIKQLVSALKEHAVEDTKRFEIHDGRLKILENWRWYVFGAIGALSALIYWLKG